MGRPSIYTGEPNSAWERTRHTLLVASASMGLASLSGCDRAMSNRFSRLMDLFETVLYATFACCGFFFFVLFIGNLVSLGYNLVRPTKTSRLAGFGFGVPHAALGLMGALGGIIEPPRLTNPDSPTFSAVGGEIDWVSTLVGLGVSGLFTALGIGAIVAAVFAGPRLAEMEPS